MFLEVARKDVGRSSLSLHLRIIHEMGSNDMEKFSICMQWLMGFLSFWHRGEARTARLRVPRPWHVFLGLYTYGLAVATAETGLLEKLTFLQTRRNVSKHCPESMVVNGLGLGLALLSGIVILAAVSPKHQTPLPNKLVYSDAKCLSS
jgi:cytochrome b-561